MASSSALDFDYSLVALLSSYVGGDAAAAADATATPSAAAPAANVNTNAHAAGNTTSTNTTTPTAAGAAVPTGDAPPLLVLPPCDTPQQGARGHSGDDFHGVPGMAGSGRVQGRGRSTPSIYRWHQLDPGEGPATRGRHTVGIDAKRETLVMFGGQNYDLKRKYNDVAKFDLAADRWISVEDPDATGEECGTDNMLAGLASMTIALPNAAQRASNVPCPRSSHASVATDDALFIFGGATGKSFAASPGCCSDASTWRYTFETGQWAKVEAPGLDALSARYGHTTVLAPNDVVYLFGGMTDAGCDWNTYKIDLRHLRVERVECSFVGTAGDVCGPLPDAPVGAAGGGGMQIPAAAGSSLSPAIGHVLAQPAGAGVGTNLSGTYAEASGGAGAGGGLAGGYSSAFDTVCPPAGLAHPPAAPFRQRKTAQQVRECLRGFGHTAIYNPKTDSMYVLGGTVDGQRYHSTFLRLDLKTRRWMLEESVNPAPEGRYVHCASYDDRRNAMYVFGGYCGSYRNDVHEYDFNTRRWTEIKPHPLFPEGPSFRSGACSVVWKDHIYIFGGCDDTTYYKDVWKLRLYNDTISLRDTMLEWVAWQQAKGSMLITDVNAPAPLVKQLVSKEVEYKLLYPKIRRQPCSRRGLLAQVAHSGILSPPKSQPLFPEAAPVAAPPVPHTPEQKTGGGDDDDDDMNISSEFNSPIDLDEL